MKETEVKLTKLAQCAGCGAKVGAGTLAKLLEGLPIRRDENLLVGFEKSDDAAVYRISEELALVQTVDFFPPMVDDPYTFGQIAAANALSDVYAMGGEPKLCLNLLAVPKAMGGDAVQAILRGGYDKVYEAGAVIAGGHSILDEEPKYGLCVTGFVHPEKALTNTGAKPGDVLLLTKPLGIGILTTAAKAALCSEAAMVRAVEQMTALNKTARNIMVRYRVHGCTDVTGFGLLGHLLELTQGSGTQAVVYSREVPLLDEALSLARDGILPEGMYRNRKFAQASVDAGDIDLALQDVFYDPQTSGGLLMAVAEEDAEACLRELQAVIPHARAVGRVEPYGGGKRIFLREDRL